MNKQQEPRVLAYTLAKEITQEALTEVSGCGEQMTHYITFAPSGSIRSSDNSVDVRLDW